MSTDAKGIVVIPNTTGIVARYYYRDKDDADGKLYFEESPIIGWTIDGIPKDDVWFGTPILLETDPGEGVTSVRGFRSRDGIFFPEVMGFLGEVAADAYAKTVIQGIEARKGK